MSKITYTNKETIGNLPHIQPKNKVQADDMNEIKSVVNENDDLMGDLSNLQTTDKSSIVAAINEIRTGLIATDFFSEGNISVNSNSSYGVEIDITKEGYTPIGLLLFDINNNNITLNKYSIYNNVFYARIYNLTSSSITCTVTCVILYIKE